MSSQEQSEFQQIGATLEGRLNDILRLVLDREGCALRIEVNRLPARAEIVLRFTDEEFTRSMAVMPPAYKELSEKIYSGFYAGADWVKDIEPLTRGLWRTYAIRPKIGVAIVPVLANTNPVFLTADDRPHHKGSDKDFLASLSIRMDE
jgi:hypothetical protein